MIDEYLFRLRVEREAPSADALRRLHRAHVQRVPYETVWIHMGERYGCSAEESLARIAGTSRGGYCFHLNGAFSELLAALDYDVVRHVGGVHGPDGPSDQAMTNHLVLTVHGLPSGDNPAGDWYVDVGLGDALFEPLPLRAGVYEQPPFRLELDETPGGVGDWHLTHDPAGSFPGMAWRSAPAELAMFEPMNTELSTSPESGFVKTLSVQRRSARAVDVLRGAVLLRVGDGAHQRTLTSGAELTETLNTVFGFDLDDFSPDALDALWDRVHAAHQAWQSAQ
ncbi:MAG TPA: arylamine N-acetyltransferase [Acidimicrobiales bacterium]